MTAPAPALRADREYAFFRYSDAAQPCDGGTNDDDIAVKQDASWSYCGPLLPLCTSSSSADGDPSASLPASFHEFAAATFTASPLPGLIRLLEFVNALLAANGLSHLFFTVRATTPTREFDQPRWHTDELFFSSSTEGRLPGSRLGLSALYGKRSKRPSGGTSSSSSSSSSSGGTDWKICATLLGPSTLFIPLKHQLLARERQWLAQKAASTDHACLSIRCVGCASAADAVRAQLAVDLLQLGVEASTPGECAVFRVGRKSGAVHSEPRMSGGRSGRIFINIVPGTEEELRGLMGKWGMEFPRHWWVRTVPGNGNHQGDKKRTK